MLSLGIPLRPTEPSREESGQKYRVQVKCLRFARVREAQLDLHLHSILQRTRRSYYIPAVTVSGKRGLIETRRSRASFSDRKRGGNTFVIHASYIGYKIRLEKVRWVPLRP